MDGSVIIYDHEEAGAGDLAVFDPAIYERAKKIIADGTAENTQKAYKSDLGYYIAWARASGLSCELPIPSPDYLLRFIVDHLEGLDPTVDHELVDCGAKGRLGPHAISTIERRIYTLSAVHRTKEWPNPCKADAVKELLKKARSAAARRGYKPKKKKAATRDLLNRMLATCGSSPRDVRDRAILLFAFSSGGRRRSEVASAQIENLQEADGAYLYDVGLSKANQQGKEHLVPITGEAADALRAWLRLSGAGQGPIFRAMSPSGAIQPSGISPQTVGNVVKHRATLAGLDAAQFGGHSMRSGFMTEGGRKDVNIFRLMEMSGHKSVQTAQGYHQAGSALTNPGASL